MQWYTIDLGKLIFYLRRHEMNNVIAKRNAVLALQTLAAALIQSDKNFIVWHSRAATYNPDSGG